MGMEETMINEFNQEERYVFKNAGCLKHGLSLLR